MFYLIIFYIISSQLALLTSTTQFYIFAAIILAALYAVWTLSQQLYQGLDKMKKLGLESGHYALAQSAGGRS